AGSCHLAALTAGGVVSYPGVLLQQLRSNDTIIHLDLDNGSWIGSVHGLAGIPSFLMPFLMQYQGRKFTFILSCLLIIIGWAFTYAANNLLTLIIGECFHGLGGHSLLTVSFLSMSEMIQPKYRNISLLLYGTSQAFGMSFVGIIGRYLHWKTAGMVMSCPIILALILGLFWPESPSWLAFKGRFEECEDVFKRFSVTTILTRFFSSKKVLLFSMSGSFVCMTLMSVVAYLQNTHIVAKDSMLGAYFIVCFVIVFSTGSNGIGFTLATELMPVKHRGLGGCIFVICTCVFHSSSLKSFPYLCVYLNLWGAFLIYAIYIVIAGVIVFVCVPDTRNKTLQEIEEFYQNGCYKERRLVCADLSVRQKFLNDNGL
ncbi:hypothetical protein HW555_006705, partial [Spodoptera exigua]